VSASGGVGTLDAVLSKTLTGVGATGQAGTLFAYDLSVTANGQVGNVSVGERTVAITGVAGQGQVGDTSRGFDLTSVTANGAVGSVAMGARTVAITGVSATGSVGTMKSYYQSLINTDQDPNWQEIEMEI
jgi:hypothetical protein